MLRVKGSPGSPGLGIANAADDTQPNPPILLFFLHLLLFLLVLLLWAAVTRRDAPAPVSWGSKCPRKASLLAGSHRGQERGSPFAPPLSPTHAASWPAPWDEPFGTPLTLPLTLHARCITHGKAWLPSSKAEGFGEKKKEKKRQ